MTNLRQVIDDVTHRFEIYIIGSLWGYAQRYYVGDLVWASPFAIVTIFWSCNWIIGSAFAAAQKEPLPGQPDLRWDPKKSLKSLLKLLIWVVALGVSLLLQYSHVTGGWIPAGVIQLVVIVTEGAYLLRNLGRIAKAIGNTDQGNLLSAVADSTEGFVDHQIHKKTTVTITETETSTSNPTSQTSQKKEGNQC